MTNSTQTSNQATFVANALEAFIRIGVVGLLVIWCFRIGRPFIQIILWGIIITVALRPIHGKIQSALGGRGKVAALLITLFALVIFTTVGVMLSGTLIDGARELSFKIKEGTLAVPPAPKSVKSWPIIGKPLYEAWRLASVNLAAALSRFTPQLTAFSQWLIANAARTGVGILKFIVSIFIAGVLLTKADSGYKVANAIGTRLAGEQGEGLVNVATSTLRSVVKGIIGVAVIQSLLTGIGCLAAGVPGAGLWALLVLIIAVAQLPTLLVLAPIVIYVFSTASTVTAVLFMIWSIFVGLCDNFLKPILLGRGVEVPMVIVFIGAIGGFINSGIIGLFIGAIVFVVGYQLFLAWLHQKAAPIEELTIS
ncbi:MAG: AI-2E family transporter [Deltaproteobacteria bacterium]|nr:MAG: AI-2E family transporter [Deltaproteobacteria bacterium]